MRTSLILNLILINATSIILTSCLPMIVTGAAGSAVMLARDKTTEDTIADVRISTAIKAEIIKKKFKELYTKIKIEVWEGRVLLTGDIEKEEDAMQAVEIAWNQKGVKEVINELKVDKMSNNFNLMQYTRDTLITSQIKSKIFLNREVKFVNYTVITLKDIVYLFGVAHSEEELRKVANIASNIYGVEKVVSYVKIGAPVNTKILNNNSDDDNLDNIPKSVDEDPDAYNYK